MTQIKAMFFLALVFFNWASLIIIMLPLMVVAKVVDKILPNVKWLYSILLAQDHLVHAIMGGHFKTTISGMLGYLKLARSRTGTVAAKVVDLLFYIALGQTNHCVGAMEIEDIHLFSARRAIGGSICYYASIYFVVNAIISVYF